MSRFFEKVAQQQGAAPGNDNPSETVEGTALDMLGSPEDGSEDVELDQEEVQDAGGEEETPELFQDIDETQLTPDMVEAKRLMEKRFYAGLQEQAASKKALDEQLAALSEENKTLQSTLRDPKQVEAMQAYHAKLAGTADAAAQIQNPYGAPVAATDDGDGGWAPEALQATRGAAFDVVANDFYPAVEKNLTLLANEIVALKSRFLTQDAKEALSPFEGVEGLDVSKVQQFAQEKNLTVQQAAMVLHGEDALKAAKAAPAKKQLRRKAASPQPNLNGPPPSRRRTGGESFAQALDKALPDLLARHPGSIE